MQAILYNKQRQGISSRRVVHFLLFFTFLEKYHLTFASSLIIKYKYKDQSQFLSIRNGTDVESNHLSIVLEHTKIIHHISLFRLIHIRIWCWKKKGEVSEVGQFSQLVGTARNGGEKIVGGVRPVARSTTRYDNYIGLRRGLIGPRGRRSPRIALADSQGILLSSHEPRYKGREKDPIIFVLR